MPNLHGFIVVAARVRKSLKTEIQCMRTVCNYYYREIKLIETIRFSFQFGCRNRVEIRFIYLFYIWKKNRVCEMVHRCGIESFSQRNPKSNILQHSFVIEESSIDIDECTILPNDNKSRRIPFLSTYKTVVVAST